jgi:hypothetical protein
MRRRFIAGVHPLTRSRSDCPNKEDLADSEMAGHRSHSGILDGIFSIGVRVGPGVTATLNGVTAAGFYIAYGEPNSGTGDRDVTTSPVAVTLVTPATVPEPATVVLVGLGLSRLVMTRRRWR